MFRKFRVAAAVLTVAISSLVIPGCSSDSSNPTGPGNPGGGGTKVAAGTFNITLSQWTCGMMDTMSVVLVNQSMCNDFSFDELFELDCAVSIVNNMFTIDCTTQVTDGGCSYTETVQATGTLSGTTWTVEGTVSIMNETPPGCSGEAPCSNVRVVVERTGGPPSACTYADANTVEATVVGGPFAGNTDFQTQGFGNAIGNIFSWNINAFAESGTAVVKRLPDRIQNIANLNLNLSDIDATALPSTFTIMVVGGGTAALPDGNASYYDQTTTGTYFFSTGGSGSITVNEVSATHIAGTINSLSIQGLEGTPGGGEPTAATRSLSGGFHVLQGVEFKPGWHGWIERLQAR